MSVETLIDELDSILKTQKVPLFSGKLLVDTRDFARIIDELRSSLPKEIPLAKSIVADRTKILNDAKDEAKSMLEAVQEKIKRMASKEEVSRLAKLSADETIRQARLKAREIKDSADSYVFDLMKETDNFLSSHLAQVRKVKQNMRNGEMTMESQD